jgi:hypothetical protein
MDELDSMDQMDQDKFDRKESIMSMEEESYKPMNSFEVSGLGMSDFNIGKKVKDQYQDLREIYINNYGVQMEVPSFNFIDGKLVPNQ